MLCRGNYIFPNITLLMSRSCHPIGRACKDHVSVDELSPFIGCVVTGNRLGGSDLWVQGLDVFDTVLRKSGQKTSEPYIE